MKKGRFDKLVNKLNNILNTYGSDETVGGLTQTVSPEGQNSPWFIKKDMSLNRFSEEQLQLIHTLLHFFHSSNTGKNLEKKDIESLHRDVKNKLKYHKYFDRLDG